MKCRRISTVTLYTFYQEGYQSARLEEVAQVLPSLQLLDHEAHVLPTAWLIRRHYHITRLDHRIDVASLVQA
jgi:hypothetical protein